MDIKESKRQFIELWGNFGSQWGINKSMAQVHALLLSSSNPISTDDVMEQLHISRGNANTSLRELMNWNLIYKVSLPGERKEYFKAEKDMWTVAKRIARERKRREIEPLMHHLQELQTVEGMKKEDIEYADTLAGIERMVGKLNTISDGLMKAEESKFFGMFINLLK